MFGGRTSRWRLHAVAAIVGASGLVLIAGCGSGTESSDRPATTEAGPAFERQTGKDSVAVNVIDNTFEPRYLEVSVGTTLVFTNNGRNPHDIKPVTAGAFDEVLPEQFEPGATAEITLNETGEIPYYCSIHGTPKNGQNGIIKVVS